jgi:uncharacterized membrane protein YhaH (DUF805 family)
MLDPILDKLDLSGPNLGIQALALSGILYALVLFCTYSSIFSQRFPTRTKMIWISLVTFLPFVGILAYLLICTGINLRNHPIVEHFTRRKQKAMPPKK